MNKLLEYLKKDPAVYYIYRSDPSIFGAKCNYEQYLVITSSDYDLSKCDISKEDLEQKDGFVVYNNTRFKFRDTAWFFEKIQRKDIDALIFKALAKKDMIKEFVKVPVVVDLEQASKDTNSAAFHLFLQLSGLNSVEKSEVSFSGLQSLKSAAFNYIKCTKLLSQIKEFGKIINLNELKKDYEALDACQSVSEIENYFNNHGDKDNMS